jgi:hypothetical protein
MFDAPSPVSPLARWHDLVRTCDTAGIPALLADEVVFHSPVVHTPQSGKKIAGLYLQAAFQVFNLSGFRYVREIVGPRDAALEFLVLIDGIVVNGIDLIAWNEEGKITDFKVMLRPLQAIKLIHQKMAAAAGQVTIAEDWIPAFAE